VPRGCVSSSSLGTSHEVHVLSVQWSKAPALPLKVSVVPQAVGCTRPAVLVLLCAHCSATITSPCPDLLVRTVSAAAQPPQEAAGLGPSLEVTEQLLAWAQSTYGGITSYSELRDPRRVQLRLGEDTGSPPDCVPQEHFDAAPHLETEVFFHGMKGCSRGDAQSTRAAHIIQLQHEPRSPLTEVNLSLSCPERVESNQILILQSRTNLTWSLSVNNCHIQFLVSGNYKITPISSRLLPGELLPDTEQGLVAKAFEKNYSVIASYSTIPTSAHISLEIQEHEVVRKAPTTSTLPAPSTDSLPNVLLLMLQPWKCTDETMEIVIARSHLEPIKDVVNMTLRDISCQAEKNATHFMLKTPLSHCGTSLEGRGHANNELILNLANGTVLRSVRVAFQCKIPRELFLRLFPSAAFEVPQTELEVNKEAFVQPGEFVPQLGSIIPGPQRTRGIPALSPATGAGGDGVGRGSLLSPQPSPLQNNTIFEKVLEVTVKDGWRPPNGRGLGLAGGPGNTFRRALLTAGLWYIYSHTRPMSKLQPVSSTAPASESSSTHHSIGSSTQSTPCSTSSMA
ncbi:Endoglin, partial [Chaetura pelagica]